MIRLFTTWYPCADPNRHGEMSLALENNLKNPALGQVCILREGQADLPSSEKLQVRDIASRPNFTDFFVWIKERQGPDDIALIANTDIWFDQSIVLAEQFLKSNQCWALARWDCRKSGSVLFDRNDSQDAWAFRGELRDISGDFLLGAPRCDNRLLYELQAANYETLNPAFSVTCHHQHNEEPREYAETNQQGFVDAPYRYLWPHNLLPAWQTPWHNLRSSHKVRWQIDPRKISHSLPVRAWRRLTNAQ
ncbi:hypothetical protein [Cerasicoccus arenae]|uniref:Uncharacterized protein n=1 Tax=Cerasicoccus arenae TaxID=424488 RepID=A0A8J3D9K4_9BACT|nr:hypothetical protein [Cerasicoccus arenae]MBK1857043.1 hypothetical protein [Cerasicoccus arenae]GHB92032.1 hypothetical protein GCM10007047_03770 [Cerasicoccus arenae]